MPNTNDVNDACFPITTIENSVVETENFSMYTIFSWISWTDVRKRLKNINSIDDGRTHFYSGFDALLILSIMSDNFRQVTNRSLCPNQFVVH